MLVRACCPVGTEVQALAAAGVRLRALHVGMGGLSAVTTGFEAAWLRGAGSETGAWCRSWPCTAPPQAKSSKSGVSRAKVTGANAPTSIPIPGNCRLLIGWCYDARGMHKNLAICHVIASVVSADGIMEDAERLFLEEAMEDLGLTPDEATQVRDFKNDGAEDTVRSMPTEDKERLRDGLIAATLADGKISPHETAVVKHITELMGI